MCKNSIKIGENSRKCGKNPLIGTFQFLTGDLAYETETSQSSQEDPDM